MGVSRGKRSTRASEGNETPSGRKQKQERLVLNTQLFPFALSQMERCGLWVQTEITSWLLY